MTLSEALLKADFFTESFTTTYIRPEDLQKSDYATDFKNIHPANHKDTRITFLKHSTLNMFLSAGVFSEAKTQQF